MTPQRYGYDVEVFGVKSPPQREPARLRLLGLAVPEVVRPSTRDISEAQASDAVLEVKQLIESLEQRTDRVSNLEIKLRIELEQGEDKLKQLAVEAAKEAAIAALSDDEPTSAPAPAPSRKKSAAAAPVAPPGPKITSATHEHEAGCSLSEQALVRLKQLRLRPRDEEESVKAREAALRDAHRDGTQLLEWLGKAALRNRKKRIFYTQKRATRLRSEAMTTDTMRQRQRFEHERAATLEAIEAQAQQRRDATRLPLADAGGAHRHVGARYLEIKPQHGAHARATRTRMDASWSAERHLRKHGPRSQKQLARREAKLQQQGGTATAAADSNGGGSRLRNSASLPELPSAYTKRARSHGGVDFRPAMPNAHGVGRASENSDERLRIKWKRDASLNATKTRRQTIFDADDDTRFRYDHILGAVPVS